MSLITLFGLGDQAWDHIGYTPGQINYANNMMAQTKHQQYELLAQDRPSYMDNPALLANAILLPKTQAEIDYEDAVAKLDKEFPGSKDW